MNYLHFTDRNRASILAFITGWCWCDCLQCRMVVERVNKNHLVNNLVEAYLKANPGRLFS